MSEPLLRVEGLVKHFPVRKGFLRRTVGVVRAVDGVSFALPPRGTVALVGESGCGKTTVGRAILRLIEPDAGHAWFRGADLPTLAPEALRQMRRHMQIVFQDPYASLNPRHTVGQIIGRPMVLHGLCTAAESEDRAREVLQKVGLQPSYASRYPHEFSGGQRQRVGIARAVALRPDFIVCDEAVSALDVSVRAQVLNLLMDLQAEMGLSYLFVTHDLSVVEHIADHIVVMYLGQVVEQGPKAEVLARASHPYTKALLSAAPDPRHALAGHAAGTRPKRIVLTGDVPSPLNPPSGCRFHTRCPYFQDAARYGLGTRCAHEAPVTRELGPGHSVACHLESGVESGHENPPPPPADRL